MRSHITRFLAVLLLWTGFGLYLVQPAQAESSSRSFANWLDSMVKTEQTANVKEQIRSLKKSDIALCVLIEQASHLVSENNGMFNLPFSDHGSTTDHIYQLLVVEWNHFQMGNAMGKAPVQESVKVLHKIKLDPVSGFYNDVAYSQDIISFGKDQPASGPVIVVEIYNRTPLASGRAIGAP